MAGRWRSILGLCLFGSYLTPIVPAAASETINYSYDARGRLVKVVRSGSVNNGVETRIEHDKADNRKKVTTTGVS